MLSGIATAIIDNIINTIFDNIDESVNDEHIYKHMMYVDMQNINI